MLQEDVRCVCSIEYAGQKRERVYEAERRKDAPVDVAVKRSFLKNSKFFSSEGSKIRTFYDISIRGMKKYS